MSDSKGIWVQMTQHFTVLLFSSEMDWYPPKLYDFINNSMGLMVKGTGRLIKGTFSSKSDLCISKQYRKFLV